MGREGHDHPDRWFRPGARQEVRRAAALYEGWFVAQCRQSSPDRNPAWRYVLGLRWMYCRQPGSNLSLSLFWCAKNGVIGNLKRSPGTPEGSRKALREPEEFENRPLGPTISLCHWFQ